MPEFLFLSIKNLQAEESRRPLFALMDVHIAVIRTAKSWNKKLNFFSKKLLTFLFQSVRILYNKCEEQKPVGWKEPGESCRLVRGKGGVLLEFLLLAVR